MLVLFLLIGFVLPAVGEKVTIRVNDAESGRTVAARAYLKCGGKPLIPEGVPSYRRGLEEHFLLKGADTLDLPAGPCEIEVVRGLEYEPARVQFTAGPGSEVIVPIRRWVSMNREGWYSADMHVHRDPKELTQILLAEDLNFVPTITYHVWSESVSQPFPPETAFPVQVDESHFYTANSQEVERIQGGPGAVILLAKKLPIPFEGTEFYPPAVYFTRQAHAQGGYVEGDKAVWLDTFVNVALGEIDFIELNCNHFLPYDVDTDLIPWSHWPVEMGYHGDHQFALWMMDSYYRMLNCGFPLPLSGGSASGVKATPVGYDRVYVFLGEQPLSYDSFMKAMKQGRTFTTNGPLIDMRVNGQVGPGARVAAGPNAPVQIDAVVRSRKGLEGVDLIVNGRVHRSIAAHGEKEIKLVETLKPEVSSWVAVRAFEASPVTVVFAHTSPAYLQVGDRPVRVPEDAAILLAKTDDLIRYTEQKGVFANPAHRDETLKLYREARKVYERLAADAAGSNGSPAGQKSGGF